MLGGIGPLAIVAGSAALILLIQPDTAGVIIIGAASVAILFAAGGRVSHLLLLALIGALAVGAAAYERPYIAQRIETYLHQTSDPQGAGWQIQQSLIAVGSGGLTGRGFGQSIEKFSYLPEPSGDSIFAVAGEEFGFIGASVLVLLYLAFGLLGLRIASRAADPFGGLIATGLVILIIGQSFFNIASALGAGAPHRRPAYLCLSWRHGACHIAVRGWHDTERLAADEAGMSIGLLFI